MSEPSKKEQRRLATARDLEARGHLEHAAKAYVKAGRPADAARLFVQIGRPADAARALIASVAEGCAAVAPTMEIEAQALVHAAIAYFRQAGDGAEADRYSEALMGAAAPIELVSSASSSPDLEVQERAGSTGLRRPSTSGIPAARSGSSSPPPRMSSPGASRAPSSPGASHAPSPPGASRLVEEAGPPHESPLRAPSSPGASRAPSSPSASRAPSSPGASRAPSSPGASGAPSSPGASRLLEEVGPPRAPSSLRAPSSGLVDAVGLPQAPSSLGVSRPTSEAPRPSAAPARGHASAAPRDAGTPGAGTSGEGRSDFRRAAGWRDRDGGEIEATIRDLLSKGKKGAAARVAWDAGQHERALAWFLEVDLKYQAGACLRALGRAEEALEMMVALSVDDTRYRRACFDIIELVDATGRFDFEVDRFLTRFVAEGPRDPQENAAFLSLAGIYERFGFARGARSCVECVLRMSPDEVAAQAMLERLGEAERAAAVQARASRPPPPRRTLTALPPLPSLDEYRALARRHAPPPTPRRD